MQQIHTYQITFAGVPWTWQLSGTSLLTIEHAPTVAFLPIVKRGKILQPTPRYAPLITKTFPQI